MIAKKNKKANLERKRFAFFQIGLLVSGSLVLAAFEYSTVTADEQGIVFQNVGDHTFVPEPILDDPLKPRKEKVKTAKVVNTQQIDSIIFTTNMNPTGDVVTTTNNNVTITEGGGDIGDGIDLGLSPENSDKVFKFAEIEPSFVGGEGAMFNWLKKEIEYPEMCAEMGIQGVTYISFVVNVNGSICQVKNAGSPHEDLTAEAMRVVKKMPKWIPGEQAGKKVRVRYTLPIKFTLH